MYDERQLGGNSRLLFADSCQIVLFPQTSGLNQSKTIPKWQDIFKCFVKKKEQTRLFFIQSLLTSLKVSLTILANSLGENFFENF